MKPRSISLVLGSGGARGLAQIGVIKALKKHDLEIKSISGCSIGALVGGFYAADKLDEYEQWVRALDRTSVLKLLDFSFDRRGLFKGEKIIDVLKELVGDKLIETLPVKFTAVATDIQREKEIWFQEGSLFNAIRASISVPSIFTPHYFQNMKLVDGGLLNPVPVAPTAGDDTDLTLAVNLNARNIHTANQNLRLEEELVNNSFKARVASFIEKLRSDPKAKVDHDEQLNILDLLNRSIDIMQNSIAHAKFAIYRPDILIEIQRNAGGFFDFHRADELIALGEQLAEEKLKDYFLSQE